MKSEKIKNYSNYTISSDGIVTRELKNGTTKAVTIRYYRDGTAYFVASGGTVTSIRIAKTVIEMFGSVHLKDRLSSPYSYIVYKDGNKHNCSITNLDINVYTDMYGKIRTTIDGVAAVSISNDSFILEDGYVYNKNTGSKYKPHKVNGYNYLRIPASTNAGVNHSANIHRVVAEFFVANPNNYPIVDHIDENKSNNASSNLRWCTYTQNNNFYINNQANKDVRRRKAADSAVKKAEAKITRYREEAKALKQERKKLYAELAAAKKELEAEKRAFAKLKESELALIERCKNSYIGYADVKGTKFSSKDEMIIVLGKEIVVDGTKFVSAGAAAKYIVDKEALLGADRKHSTVSKELRKFLNGKRPQWIMYNTYTIGY